MLVNYSRGTQNARAATKSLKISLIDKICYAGSVFMPATAIPQIYKLYATQDATSLSLAMWVLYLVGVIPFLLFGIVHNEKQLITLNVLWVFAIIAMIAGIIIYS